MQEVRRSFSEVFVTKRLIAFLSLWGASLLAQVSVFQTGPTPTGSDGFLMPSATPAPWVVQEFSLVRPVRLDRVALWVAREQAGSGYAIVQIHAVLGNGLEQAGESFSVEPAGDAGMVVARNRSYEQGQGLVLRPGRYVLRMFTFNSGLRWLYTTAPASGPGTAGRVLTGDAESTPSMWTAQVTPGPLAFALLDGTGLDQPDLSAFDTALLARANLRRVPFANTTEVKSLDRYANGDLALVAANGFVPQGPDSHGERGPRDPVVARFQPTDGKEMWWTPVSHPAYLLDGVQSALSADGNTYLAGTNRWKYPESNRTGAGIAKVSPTGELLYFYDLGPDLVLERIATSREGNVLVAGSRRQATGGLRPFVGVLSGDTAQSIGSAELDLEGADEVIAVGEWLEGRILLVSKNRLLELDRELRTVGRFDLPAAAVAARVVAGTAGGALISFRERTSVALVSPEGVRWESVLGTVERLHDSDSAVLVASRGNPGMPARNNLQPCSSLPTTTASPSLGGVTELALSDGSVSFGTFVPVPVRFAAKFASDGYALSTDDGKLYFLRVADAASKEPKVSCSDTGSDLAPGETFSIFGEKLSANAPGNYQLNAEGRIPTNMQDVSVTVAGEPAPLLYTSADQINLVAPTRTPLGPQQVCVNNAAGQSCFAIEVKERAPRVLSVLNEDGSLNSERRPANGRPVTVLLTGSGPLTGGRDGEIVGPVPPTIGERPRVSRRYNAPTSSNTIDLQDFEYTAIPGWPFGVERLVLRDNLGPSSLPSNLTIEFSSGARVGTVLY